MHKIWLGLGAACVAAGVCWFSDAGTAADPEPAPQVDFARHIQPVLKQKCLGCHNPDKKEGELDMSTREAMLKGGNSGPALVPGEAEKSLMLELIEFDEMPPRDEEPRVTKAEFQKLRAWVDGGAPVPKEKE